MTNPRSPRIESAWNNVVPLTLGVGLIAFLAMLPDNIFYKGLISRLAEWQFNRFGTYFPVLTIAIPIAIIVGLVLLVLWLLARANRRSQANDADGAAIAVPLEERRAAALRSARLGMRAFSALAIASGIGALATIASIIGLPAMAGTQQAISVGALPFAVPREGPAKLSGTLEWQRMARFDQGVVLANKTIYVVPVVGAPGPRASVRYFAQVYRSEFEVPNNRPHDSIPENRRVWESGRVDPKVTTPISGTLRAGGLPDELVYLYRKAGLNVHPDHYVLFRDGGSMRWPYVLYTAGFILMGLASLLVALFHRRQTRRLLRTS